MDRISKKMIPYYQECTDAEVTEEEKEKLSKIVHACVEGDAATRLLGTLMKYKFKERKAIVNCTVDRNAPLFKACVMGFLNCVKVLVDKCGANMEQTGVYQVPGETVRHIVTPVWVASVANNLEVVKYLTEQGADINAVSDSESTPVRSACYMTNMEVVRYLVENGANIHRPNVNGGTCLINSVQSRELCEFLISKGASLNETDNSGNQAIHYAIREGHIDTVKLLLCAGCDYRMPNNLGDDALQCAGLRGQPEVVDMILAKARLTEPFSLQREVDALELLGCYSIEKNQNPVEGWEWWRKAMERRYSQNPPLLKILPTETHQAFHHAREPNSMEDLRAISGEDTISMQSLLMKIRILGPSHKDTAFSLMYRGAVYADAYQFQKCVDLWKYALVMRYTNYSSNRNECIFTVQALCKLLWEMQMAEPEERSWDRVIPTDVIEIFDIMVGLVEEFLKVEENAASEDITHMMQLCLHMMHLGVNLEQRKKLDEEQAYRLRCMVYRLVQMGPRTKEGGTLLHVAADPLLHTVSEEFVSMLPSGCVINLLLDCGVDIDAPDALGRSPLHSCKAMTPQDRGAEVPFCLLANGAHGDFRSSDGLNPLEHLRASGFSLNPLQFLSLKCLCAQVIRRENIPFEDELPKCMVTFVKRH